MTMNDLLDERVTASRPPWHRRPYWRPYYRWYPRHYTLAGALFGLGVGALTTATLISLRESYEEKNDEKMISCENLPPGIEVRETSEGNKDCADVGGGMVCFYEVKKGEPKACYFEST